MLEAVKVWPGNLGACRKVGATANLDSLRAPALQYLRVGAKKPDSRRNKETDEGQKICRFGELLDKKSPIQGVQTLL